MGASASKSNVWEYSFVEMNKLKEDVVFIKRDVQAQTLVTECLTVAKVVIQNHSSIRCEGVPLLSGTASGVQLPLSCELI